jgi:hypothetical protein
MPPMLAPKYGEPAYLANDAYEMKSRSGKSTSEVIVTEENESKYKGATVNDRQDMDRLGKTQELRVRTQRRHLPHPKCN